MRLQLTRSSRQLVQSYLLFEPPGPDTKTLGLVGEGPPPGRPLSDAGLREMLSYPHDWAGGPADHPHSLRFTFATALTEAGVDFAVS